MTTTTVREAIHEKLDPVIEEIVAREISQRGGYSRGLEQEQGGSFQALMPILLSTITQRRQAGKELDIEAILPMLLPTLLQRRQAGEEAERPTESILPLLLVNVLQRREGGKEMDIETILPILLPTLLQRRHEQVEAILPMLLLPALLQRRREHVEAILPLLLSVIGRRPQEQEQGQEHPLQKLAPVLVAALTSR